MDIFRAIEVKIAEAHGAVAAGTRKSIGDFLLDDDIRRPVNVKSNNLNKQNYSPNIISARRLIEWLKQEENELYFIFVDYQITGDRPEIVRDSGLVPVHKLSWNCLTIEAQGWGVIQMCKSLEIDPEQDKEGFLRGIRSAYETFINKEAKKVEKIKEMIKDF